MVAFWATLDVGGEGIFTGTGGPTTTIADTSGPFLSFSGFPPSVNSGGTVAFRAFLDAGGVGIFTGSGGPTTTLYDSSGPFSGFGGMVSINDAGTVAFFANPDAGGQGIFTGSGGPTTTIADDSGPFSTFGFFPAINNGGAVAFRASLDAGGQGIFTGSGGPTTTIADDSGPFSTLIGAGPVGETPSINDGGTVAFRASLDAGGQGIFTGSGGPTTTIADDSGPFISFSQLATINSGGMVAFGAQPDVGFAGIFIGPDPIADKVIASGDPLDGTLVNALGIFSEALNDSGQIAFLAVLADGRSGIFRADPVTTTVPEPPSLLLVGGGLVGMAALRRRLSGMTRNQGECGESSWRNAGPGSERSKNHETPSAAFRSPESSGDGDNWCVPGMESFQESPMWLWVAAFPGAKRLPRRKREEGFHARQVRDAAHGSPGTPLLRGGVPLA
jgi:hypothetical protein